MFFSDLSFIFIWWLVFFLIGIIFLPITTLIFSRFLDRGYIFSKILGMLVVSYLIFLLGTLKLLPFSHNSIMFVLFAFGVASIAFLVKVQPLSWLILGNIPWKLFIFEELLFFVGLTFWSFIRAHEPSIHGLEKYMDFGFVNSVLQTDFFPAKDLWLAPLSINYYYFGHIVTAVLTKLSGIDPAITYNLMIATLFAFTFTGAFSIGANLIAMINSKSEARNPKQYQNPNDRNTKRFEYSNFENSNLFRVSNLGIRILIGGLLAGFLVALAGNLHTIYAFFTAYNGENPVPLWTLDLDFNLSDYWYPNATRFIPFTIHEFPIYSAVVSDLHGHVLSIPIVLTIIALLLNILISQSLNIFKIILISFLLATAYMTNAWDGLIYALLTAMVFLYLAFQPKNYTLLSAESKLRLYAKRYTLIVIGSILFSLPFSLFFKPFVSGIGVICAPQFLINIGRLGPFLFEADHCQRSPLWQFIILHGFWYFWVIAFLIFLYKKGNSKLETRNSKQIQNPNGQSTKSFRISDFGFRILPTDVFVLILIGLSTFLLLLPEFIYAKDIYPGHYRANTMFKLGYEAFMMLGISTAYTIIKLITNYKLLITNFRLSQRLLLVVLVCIGSIGLFLVGIYPYFAINSYYGNLKTYKGLDGLSYLKDLYPTDYEAILWLRENIKGQPVILEGAGESYTDYARVSANTGLPTVVGWPVHEWLWRGSYDEAGKRVSEVEQMYTAPDTTDVRQLLEKYNVDYVFVGVLERQKYPALNEETFKTLGTPIYQNGQTTIYKVRAVLE